MSDPVEHNIRLIPPMLRYLTVNQLLSTARRLKDSRMVDFGVS